MTVYWVKKVNPTDQHVRQSLSIQWFMFERLNALGEKSSTELTRSATSMLEYILVVKVLLTKSNRTDSELQEFLFRTG